MVAGSVKNKREVDLAICIVEAAGRGGVGGDTVLRSAMDHPSALVRWSAVKLLGDRKGARSLLVRAAKDRHALVRRRADQALAVLDAASR